MVSRRIVRLFGALTLTRPVGWLSTACGLSATMASMTGRDSSLAWKAMNTSDMGCVSGVGGGSGLQAGLGEAGLQLFAGFGERRFAGLAQGEAGDR